MEDESALALEADPTTIAETLEGDTGQDTIPPAEADAEEKKTEAAKRRERDKATRARMQTERDEALSRARQLEAERDAWKKQASEIKLPKDDDFPDPFDLVAEKASVGSERRALEREANKAGSAAEAAQREAEAITAREQAAIEQSWAAQREEAKQRYADFEQVALSDEVPISRAMGELIKTSDMGADVAYHLGQNRDLAAQIAKLSPVEAARAIGRIEASLTQPKPRTQTNAPDPITPVKGAAGVSRDPNSMSMEEWIAARKTGKIR